MSPDEQEALSRRYGDEVIMLLPLRSGRLAIFNNARELCGFVALEGEMMDALRFTWRAPKKAERKSVDLEELGLL